VTREHVIGRLLVGLPYEFEQAVSRRVYGCVRLNTKSSTGIAVEAAVALIYEVCGGGTDWHVHRGLELMLHIYHQWRIGLRMSAGPELREAA
jgi:hypothetical protein